MEDKKEMLALRERGLSYQEIADIYHISKQRVYQIIGKENVRRFNADIDKIVYKGIYEFMRDNPSISFSNLHRTISSHSTANAVKSFRRFLTNTTDKGVLTIRQIKRLMEFTGKSFEELFERRF